MANKAFVLGNLGKDPELRQTPNGVNVCSFSVATSEHYTKNGQKVEETDWHNIVVWDKQAEACGKFLTKGSKVFVEGKMKTRKYDDKNGITRYTTEIIASKVDFVSTKNDGARPPHPAEHASSGGNFPQNHVDNDGGTPSAPMDSIDFESIPF